MTSFNRSGSDRRAWSTVASVVASLAAIGTVVVGFLQWQATRAGNSTDALDTSTLYTIRNGSSGKCLDDYAFSKEEGAAIVQWTCNGLLNQSWYWTERNELRNAVSGKCLDVYAFAEQNGARVVQWTCNSLANQRWYRETDRNGNPRLKAFNGKCLDNFGFSSEDGSTQVVWECNGEANQIWYVTAKRD